jgi:truncated hemoglobin YjbI
MPTEQISAEEISELVDRFYAKVRLDPAFGIYRAPVSSKS